MATHNWCHNPDCHTIRTQSRVRGSGNNKVLRTRKIALNSEWIRNSIYSYFCNQNCLHGFLNTFKDEIANIRPVKKPSETPIKVKTVKEQSYRYRYDSVNGQERVPFMSTRTTIESINNE